MRFHRASLIGLCSSSTRTPDQHALRAAPPPLAPFVSARAGYLAMYSMEYVSCQTRTRWACPVERTRWLYLNILVAILPPRPAERVSGLAFFPIRHEYAVLV
jgi:hypothetical protein